MAEINTAAGSTKVDLTPMVDLGFLLITFFIVTTTMQEQRSMKFFLPADGKPTNIPKSTALTIVPMANNKVYYFHGDLNDAIQSNAFGVTGFSLGKGVGQLIRDKKKELKALGKEKDLMVLIYPDKLSSYKNVVDLLDEMLINDVRHYCLTSNEPTIAALNTAIMDAGK